MESTVETLSDVVARRRLRAAEKQIIQATRAAKQKRVELESLIIAYSSATLSALQSEASAPPPRQATPSSAASSRLRSRMSNRRVSRTNRRDDLEGDADGIDDLAALIMNLNFEGLISRSPGRGAGSSTAVDNNGSSVEENGQRTDSSVDADNDAVRARLAHLFNNSAAPSSSPSSLHNAINEMQRRRTSQGRGTVSIKVMFCGITRTLVFTLCLLFICRASKVVATVQRAVEPIASPCIPVRATPIPIPTTKRVRRAEATGKC